MLDGTAVGQFLYEPGQIHRTGGFSQPTGQQRELVDEHGSPAGGKRPGGTSCDVQRRAVDRRRLRSYNFLATGEVCDGDTIHDRQQPHDFFMELAVDYDRPIRGSLRWQLYAGLAGEPALGPPAFLTAYQRCLTRFADYASLARLVHITFGLITVGVSDSAGRQRCPSSTGGNRTKLAPIWISVRSTLFSARVTLLPTPRLALQVSAAHLHAAEAEFPPDLEATWIAARPRRPTTG